MVKEGGMAFAGTLRDGTEPCRQVREEAPGGRRQGEGPVWGAHSLGVFEGQEGGLWGRERPGSARESLLAMNGHLGQEGLRWTVGDDAARGNGEAGDLGRCSGGGQSCRDPLQRPLPSI